jgi:hypothetical protein
MTRRIPGVSLSCPILFFHDSIGAGIGVAAIAQGYAQKQTLTVGTGLMSTEGTYLLFLMMRHYQVPWVKRLFLEPSMSAGEFKEIQSYTGSNSDFPGERPGANDSHKDNFNESDGSDIWFDLTIKYLLPIGDGRERIIPDLRLDNGIPVLAIGGGEYWTLLRAAGPLLSLSLLSADSHLMMKKKQIRKQPELKRLCLMTIPTSRPIPQWVIT